MFNTKYDFDAIKNGLKRCNTLKLGSLDQN